MVIRRPYNNATRPDPTQTDPIRMGQVGLGPSILHIYTFTRFSRQCVKNSIGFLLQLRYFTLIISILNIKYSEIVWKRSTDSNLSHSLYFLQAACSRILGWGHTLVNYRRYGGPTYIGALNFWGRNL